MSLARSWSSDGMVARDLTPSTSSCRSPRPPPTIRSLSFLLANSTATFAAATGSREKAIAVGPVNIGESCSNFVPARASRASRFFVTLKLAPAARICRRRSVTSATVKPVWWVTTTHAVSDKRVMQCRDQLLLL